MTPKTNQPHCGSETGLALRNYVGWETAIASKLAPTKVDYALTGSIANSTTSGRLTTA